MPTTEAALLAAIVESSDDAIIGTNLSGIIVIWNKGAERIFGYSTAEAVGLPFTILIPADRFEKESEILKEVLKGKRVEHYETVRQRKDRGLIDISLTISPLKDETGKIFGAAKIARDISERVKREKQIRYQARLLDAVEQAVIATDFDGRIVYLNSFAEWLYGWLETDVLGKRLTELTAASELQLTGEILTRIRRGDSWSGELRVRRKDQSEFAAMVTHSPIHNEHGEVVGVVEVSRDITAHKQAEAEHAKLLESERQARAEAEEANRIKDEFLATISHELRNPLNVILGYSEVLVRSSEATESEFVLRAAEILRRNAIAQAQLVNDLLDLSRLQLGKFSLNLQVVSLTKTINDAVETVRAEALAKGLEVKIEMSNELVFVDGDPLRMEQIVWNLLNNAVKFTPAGGTVTVKLAKRNGFAQLAVADTGQGIEPKFLPHVFEIFRQADATISRRHGGMGIGLALVQQLVQLQGGSVSVSSGGPGHGAEFTINLPLTKEATEPRKTGSLVHPNALTGMRILVVDDSSDTVEMLRTLLEMDGAMVTTAGSGSEALEILAREVFDVILSDISMPNMDGFELLSRMRKLPNGRDVPVLALTGFGRVEDVERATAEGFFSHITKPVDVGQIVTMLQKLPARA
ncbi:MAG TPA: PAS domain S-box protein [Pyrinomonadaceae bacterium]|nr:PAS domain S-box protein [Pyrinomonadaceae bacterium]